MLLSRSSQPEVFSKNSILEHFANSQENNIARVPLLIKLQADACNFIKKEALKLVFSCEFFEIFKNTTGQLLLYSADKSVLKSDSHLPKNCLICFNESPLKMIRSAFYFILKDLFILKIFKFLCGHFGHI